MEIDLTAQVAAAYLSHNSIPIGDIPLLFRAISGALKGLENPPEPQLDVTALKPAVAIRKSVTPDYLICLEDGKKLKMLKRHLVTAYALTPEQYRAKWGLPKDYPMVAPNYAKARSDLAKQCGLGLRGAVGETLKGKKPKLVKSA